MSKQNNPKPTDLQLYFLVMRAQVGDENAFQGLFLKFSKSTLRFLQNLVKDQQAEDLNQEVWLTIYKRVASLSEPKRFKTWLFQIARNKALDYFRSSKRDSEFQEMMTKDHNDLQERSVDDEVELLNNQVVHEALQQLSTKLREVLVLNFLEGMDYDEIALITGCSLGTVKSRIYNGKQKIKELIKTKIEES
ncbi:RNA polymerase sigma factor [Roseivirga sp.]|uniref:RNA polymerase sigma factor n=1 Tax=Roseivirga sp. TaxID=1964215 RepID=UPI003B8CE931